jgi:hypothetical protein
MEKTYTSWRSVVICIELYENHTGLKSFPFILTNGSNLPLFTPLPARYLYAKYSKIENNAYFCTKKEHGFI